MKTAFSFACKDFPGMEECPGRFTAETRDELWKLIELHAAVAHGEHPAEWPTEDIARLEALVRAGQAET